MLARSPPWTGSTRTAILDAAEFDADRDAVAARAAAAGVTRLVLLPAVDVAGFDAVRWLAHAHGGAYALGIHPLVDRPTTATSTGCATLAAQRDDPRLVAVGEIGLDHFVPGLDRERQTRFYAAQLALAREFGLPVILHVRRSADDLLKHLRRTPVAGGIAHAFNGSEQQAAAFVALGLRLGFGGALTFERALQIRRLAQTLPADAIVLETDAPDIPPQWLYRRAEARPRRAGAAQRTRATAAHRRDAGAAARLDACRDGRHHVRQRAARAAAAGDDPGLMPRRRPTASVLVAARPAAAAAPRSASPRARFGIV